jgi:CO/xanthine dehydrogenase Mo-binding subunit
MEAPAFLEDIYPRNMLYALTIRSPVSNGHLIFIHFPKLPQNYSLITARNIPGENRLEDTSIPILADRKLSYIGEPVALLLGPDKSKLEELAADCKVIVNEEKGVFTNAESENEPAAAIREFQTGDTQEAFSKAARIVASSYATGIQDHWYAEPAGAVTWYRNDSEEKKDAKNKKPERTLVIKTATQWPYHVKRSAARMLALDAASISVEPTSLGLHMDGKLVFASHVACHAALGTFVTKKPVRLILNREEDFLYSPKRFGANIDIASTIDEHGNISATQIEIAVNLGAHEVNSNEILDQVCLGSIGYYKTENLKITARANRTNIPPQGSFSGFGLAQGLFAMESHVSQIADMVHADPAEWRKSRADSRVILPSGLSSKSQVSAQELVTAAAKMSDYYRKWASYQLLRQSRKGKSLLEEKREDPRGIGIALGFQSNGLLYYGEDKGSYTVEVTLTKESILEIKTSVTSSDEDFKKIWAKVACETISIEPDMVRLVTVKAPDCGPSCSSRNITAITKLVEKCCQAIRKQRFHDPLPITVRRSIKPHSGALCSGRFLPAEGKVMDISGFSKPGMAAAVVEVAVDLIECIPKIRGVWLAIDGGKIISQNRARRSLNRGTVQALGWTFAENIVFENGALPKIQYNNYAIPSPANIPPIYIDFISGGSSEPRGIGELPFTCIPAAFLQAVSQAMDQCYKTIPLDRKEIWDMVRLRNVETPAQGLK